MKERFSTTGTIENWLNASLEALKAADFDEIMYNGISGTISGVKDGPIHIDVLPARDGKVELLLESASEENLVAYKKHVARIYQSILRDKERSEKEPLGGMPDEYKPNPEERFTPAFEEEESEPSAESEHVEEEPEHVEKPEHVKEFEHTGTVAVPVWYETNWFTLLMLFLLPPIGIYLMWRNGLFTKESRKWITAIFCIYTLLWIWLIALAFMRWGPGATSNPSDEDTSEKQLLEINDYWGQPGVTDYMNQMPALISSYEALYVNGSLGTEEGNGVARSIFPQVLALTGPVLSLPQLGSDNAAKALQDKVNESATAFNNAINEAQQAIDSGNMEAINNSTVSWNAAQNLFYEINYVYSQAILATEAEGATAQPQTPATGTEVPAEEVPTEAVPTEEVPAETEVPTETPVETQETVVDETVTQ